jgi:hypothetical protein
MISEAMFAQSLLDYLQRQSQDFGIELLGKYDEVGDVSFHGDSDDRRLLVRLRSVSQDGSTKAACDFELKVKKVQ